MSKVPLPKSIVSQMSWYRMDCIPLPREYIEFHEQLAVIEVERLKELGYTIHRTYMAKDGWMDGMKVLHVIVERGVDLLKLRWHDGNQGWMRCLGGGGASLWRPEPIRTETDEARCAEDARVRAGRLQL